MLDRAYCEAAVEVLDILDYTEEDDVKKIPKKFIDFLIKCSAKDYVSTVDNRKDIEEMNLRNETKEFLGIIYRNWWATEEEKKEIYEAIATTKRKEQERLKELYSYDKLFKKTNIKESNSKDIVAVKQEKSFFKKIINKIKSFL